MRRLLSPIRLLPAVLLAYMACQPRPATPIVFAPWEEGLTLAYEDPSLPQPLQSARRMQVRVAHTSLGPGGPSLIQLDLTSSRGQMTVLLCPHDSGLDVVEASGRVLAMALPAHFPETTHWADRHTECMVIGRAAWEGASILPATSDPVGIWVEARASQAARRRTLFLPNLGEVETREERDGNWIVVNRLVARGFTDLPTRKRP